MTRVRPTHLSPNERNTSAWAARLRDRGFERLAQRLITVPAHDVQLLRELQLPRYDHRLLSCVDFMRGFQFHKRTFVHESYYLTLFPTRDGCAKVSAMGLRSLNEAHAFVRDHVMPPFDSHVVYLSELRTNIFGGSLICDGQTVLAEIAPGQQIRVAHGTCPVHWGTLSEMGISTKYSTADPAIRRLLWRSMQAIVRSRATRQEDQRLGRRIGVIRGRAYLIGYFEFAYTKPEHGVLDLIFFDAKLEPAYWNISPNRPNEK